MKWNPKTGLSGHTCVRKMICESAKLDWEALWEGEGGLVGLFLALRICFNGFNAWGWVSCAWFCTSDENWERVIRGINFLSLP